MHTDTKKRPVSLLSGKMLSHVSDPNGVRAMQQIENGSVLIFNISLIKTWELYWPAQANRIPFICSALDHSHISHVHWPRVSDGTGRFHGQFGPRCCKAVSDKINKYTLESLLKRRGSLRAAHRVNNTPERGKTTVTACYRRGRSFDKDAWKSILTLATLMDSRRGVQCDQP